MLIILIKNTNEIWPKRIQIRQVMFHRFEQASPETTAHPWPFQPIFKRENQLEGMNEGRMDDQRCHQMVKFSVSISFANTVFFSNSQLYLTQTQVNSTKYKSIGFEPKLLFLQRQTSLTNSNNVMFSLEACMQPTCMVSVVGWATTML